jgi:hypothetical protein
MTMERNFSRDEIAKFFRIVSWRPTDSDLERINAELRRRILLRRTLSLAACQGMIADICPDAVFIALEGIDNSDINTLLILAAKTK